MRPIASDACDVGLSDLPACCWPGLRSCPNCGEGIGFHYTGEDCFCNHNRSTMTCDRVVADSCSWQGCCE